MFSFFSRKSHSKPPPEHPFPQEGALDLPEPSEAHLLASPAQAPPPSLSPGPDFNDHHNLETGLDLHAEPAPDLGTVNSLRALIQSIPPKTLQTYTLHTLKSLATDSAEQAIDPVPVLQFFGALAPPPQLHCVRCHNVYFDVENTDRSCTMGHDDDSAEVSRVNRDGYGEYETLFRCCGRTVQGEGDMGPPDGWCFEGQHTTDVKRARYRDDSTPHDDGLKSCVKLLCHDSSASAVRKRRRGHAYDSDDSRHEEDDREDARSISTRGGKNKVKGESGTTPRRGRQTRRAATPSETSASAKPKSTKKRAPKKAKLDIADEEAPPGDAMAVDEEEVPKETKIKKPRAPKSKAVQPSASTADVNMEDPSVPDVGSGSVSQPASPEKKPRKPRAPKSKLVAEPAASNSTAAKGASTAKKHQRKSSTVDGTEVAPRASLRPPPRAASRAPSVPPPTPSSASIVRSVQKKPVYAREEEEESSDHEDDVPTSDASSYVPPSSGRRRSSVPDLRKRQLSKAPTAESDLSNRTAKLTPESPQKAPQTQPASRRKKLAEIVDTSVDGEVGMVGMR